MLREIAAIANNNSKIFNMEFSFDLGAIRPKVYPSVLEEQTQSKTDEFEFVIVKFHIVIIGSGINFFKVFLKEVDVIFIRY